MTIWQLFVREIKLIFWKDPRRSLFLFGASVTYLVLFSLLYGPAVVKQVPIVICDEDQSAFSRSLIQAFDDSERFQIVGYPVNQDAAEEYLQQKTAYGAVFIPAKFAQNVKAGMGSNVLVMINGANLLFTNTISTAGQEIVMSFSHSAGVQLMEAGGLLPIQAINRTGPLDFELRVQNNPTLSYLEFFIIGLALAAFQQGLFLSTGASTAGERLSSEQIRQTSALHFFLGKLLPYLLCGIAAFALTIYLAVHLFPIPFKGDWGSLLLLAVAFSLTAISFSALVGLLCRDEVLFTRLSLVYTVLAFVFSGHIWPQSAMDGFSQGLSYVFPLYYFADTVRDLLLTGYSPFYFRNLGILLLMAVLFLTISVAIYEFRRHHSNLEQSKPAVLL